ncbi:hypothetical protein BC938DRAFT_482695 [Jimgerdemannia flammicorona]|uniref:Uncharacterized protein n=1 Tax=Jimgerdemannia flammicorona TaxID=994334 RepID=A0A433QDD0_9FUNG|nr:hypothetical protein BC938DRAFT_482695 [Jimgerdemannia flammicorona]
MMREGTWVTGVTTLIVAVILKCQAADADHNPEAELHAVNVHLDHLTLEKGCQLRLRDHLWREPYPYDGSGGLIVASAGAGVLAIGAALISTFDQYLGPEKEYGYSILISIGLGLNLPPSTTAIRGAECVAVATLSFASLAVPLKLPSLAASCKTSFCGDKKFADADGYDPLVLEETKQNYRFLGPEGLNR